MYVLEMGTAPSLMRRNNASMQELGSHVHIRTACSACDGEAVKVDLVITSKEQVSAES